MNRHSAPIMPIAALLLAAGQGQRFGGAKLSAELGGMPLGLYGAIQLRALDLPLNLAVCTGGGPDFASLGFDCIALEPEGAPQSRSLALGIAAACAAGAQAVLVALADMPLVPAGHYRGLIAAFDGTVIGTQANGVAMPPAIFGECLFEELANLTGDRGARGLLQAAPLIALDPHHALDIDTPEDLAEATRQLKADLALGIQSPD